MKSMKYAFWGNVVIFLLEAFATAWIMLGFSRATGLLDGPNLQALKYYTVDSNILMGLAALVAAWDAGLAFRGKRKDLSSGCRLFVLAATAGVTLTMLVTIFFLGPTLGRTYGFFSLFAGSNFFLHLFNPVVSILVLILFERADRVPLRLTPLCLIPTAIYTGYYVAVTLAHMEHGVIQPGYDWYGFFAWGPNSVFFVVPIILLITWGIVLALRKGSRKA